MTSLPPLDPKNPYTQILGYPTQPVGGLPQPSSPDLGYLLDALMKINITKQRQYFLRQRIDLDGMIFEECRFDECELHTDSGNIHLKNCVIGPGSTVVFGPNARKIVQMASLLDPGKITQDLFAKVAQVGSIVSISIL